MKALSSILSTLGLVLTLILTSGAAHAQSGTYPKISSETPVIDLGTIPVGQPTQFYFDFENTGDGVLFIEHVKGMRREVTITSFDQVVISGSWGTIAAVVHPRRPGFKSTNLVIFSNLPYGNEAVRVRWSAE